MAHCGNLKVGDKGQRYGVGCRSKDRAGQVDECFIVGWTDREDGQPFKGMIDKRPGWERPYVVDRENGHKWTEL